MPSTKLATAAVVGTSVLVSPALIEVSISFAAASPNPKSVLIAAISVELPNTESVTYILLVSIWVSDPTAVPLFKVSYCYCVKYTTLFKYSLTYIASSVLG